MANYWWLILLLILLVIIAVVVIVAVIVMKKKKKPEEEEALPPPEMEPQAMPPPAAQPVQGPMMEQPQPIPAPEPGYGEGGHDQAALGDQGMYAEQPAVHREEAEASLGAEEQVLTRPEEPTPQVEPTPVVAGMEAQETPLLEPSTEIPVQEPAEEQPATTPEPLSVQCYNCSGNIPVESDERPLILTCPGCGVEAQLD